MGANAALVADIVASPGKAFARLRERPAFLFPVVILAALNAGIVAWYYHVVDLAWMLEQQMQGAVLAEGQPPAALRSSGARALMGTVAAVLAAASLVVALLVAAAYFAFVSMLTNDGYRFKSWFALVAWCSFPAVFAQVATAVNLLVNDATNMLPQQLNPLTFANLLGVEQAPGDSAGFVMNLNPMLIWSLVLVVLGYHAWTQRSMPTASAIVLGPVAVVGGLALALSG